MGIRYGFSPAPSSLLCAEDCASILCSEERKGDCEAGFEVGSDEFLIGFEPMQSEECIGMLLEREREHQPLGGFAERVRSGGFEASTRNAAIDWIWKVHSYYNFGPLSMYLSVNYFDRFLANHEFSESKIWMQQLLAVACLSLAIKTEETVVPVLVEMQIVGAGKFVFEPRTVQKMELLVLNTLKWRMQSVTPFTFITYYLHKFNEQRRSTQAMLYRSAKLILRTLRGGAFLGFKPSEIAAATALFVINEARTLDIGQALSIQGLLSKEGVSECYGLLKDMTSFKNNLLANTVHSVPQSPGGVLDAQCLSFSSVDTASNSNRASPATKRRKISRQ